MCTLPLCTLPLCTYKKSDEFIFHSFPEYKCLTGNLCVPSWTGQHIYKGTYVFDCRYSYMNRPIFRQVGGSGYLSSQRTPSWIVGTDPSRNSGGIVFLFPDATYVPFDSLSVTPYYSDGSQWNKVTRNVINITCIEDNNY